MSALTKTFVVLLVVCSLLLSAAVVVFVSRVDYTKTSLQRSQSELQAAQTEAMAAKNDANAVRASSKAAEDAANTRTTAIQAELLNAQKQVKDLGVQLAEKNKDIALAQLENTRLAEGLKSSEATKAALLGQVNDLRKVVDDTTKKNSDLNSAVSDLTNRLDVTERERKFLSEQVAEAQSQVAQQARALKGANISSSDQTGSALQGAAPAINGVIRSTRNIDGVPYATISVGSSQSVAKGMEFKVIDLQRGVFLGVLTVDSVEPNEAVGRLSGPHVNEVREGNEVRTQL